MGTLSLPFSPLPSLPPPLPPSLPPSLLTNNKVRLSTLVVDGHTVREKTKRQLEGLGEELREGGREGGQEGGREEWVSGRRHSPKAEAESQLKGLGEELREGGRGGRGGRREGGFE